MFEGDALLRRMVRYGVLGEEEKKLDYVLQLTTSKLLERRLQTQVFKTQLAKSVHQARVFIKQVRLPLFKSFFLLLCSLRWSSCSPFMEHLFHFVVNQPCLLVIPAIFQCYCVLRVLAVFLCHVCVVS